MSQASVLERYSEGAKQREAALCCPVDYDASLLKILPRDIIERDYGCGDPSRYVKTGDTVLDLGAGGGKICYMAAQLVGQGGRVIGVDMNDDMLALARRHQATMAETIGEDRVTFHKGKIQDLALDLDAVEAQLQAHPLSDANGLLELENWIREQRQTRPMVADASVDLVVSNCVLNLVGRSEREQMIREIYRVLKPGGRVAISDIICDEPVPESLQNDPTLWSGCISGAYHEAEFLQAFRNCGFVAVAYDKWDAAPWQVVAGIEFRSATLTAVKPHSLSRTDRGHAVIYKGPFAQVEDDHGHIYPRGERIAVPEQTFDFLTQGPVRESFVGIAPAELSSPKAWCAAPGTRRPASASKGAAHNNGTEKAAEGGGGCC